MKHLRYYKAVFIRTRALGVQPAGAPPLKPVHGSKNASARVKRSYRGTGCIRAHSGSCVARARLNTLQMIWRSRQFQTRFLCRLCGLSVTSNMTETTPRTFCGCISLNIVASISHFPRTLAPSGVASVCIRSSYRLSIRFRYPRAL
jgi:hypothetical protein